MNKKILLFMVVLVLLLTGCSRNTTTTNNKKEEIKKTTMGDDSVGYFTLEGEFEKIDGYNFLVYKDKLGTVIAVKKYENKSEEKDFKHIFNLTKETLEKTYTNVTVTQNSFEEIGYPFLDGVLIRGIGYKNDLEFCMDVYVVNTKDGGTIYLSVENFVAINDVKEYVKKLAVDYFFIM